MRGDLEWGTVPRLVRSAAERFSDLEAVVDDRVRLTFAELADRAERATRAFIRSGAEAGDRVAIWAPNVHEWVVALLGLHGAGAVLVPLNTRFKGAEAAYILEKSGARMALTVTGFLGADYAGMLREARAVLPIVVLRGDAPAGTVAWDDFLQAGDSVDPADARDRAAAVSSGSSK